MPAAFISYSWDNDAHKNWGRELATRFRGDGLDVSYAKVLEDRKTAEQAERERREMHRQDIIAAAKDIKHGPLGCRRAS
jgi:hypothetical protein